MMIGKLLGHKQIETTARYAHLARDSVKESAGRIADSIAEDILGGLRGRDVAHPDRGRVTLHVGTPLPNFTKVAT